jgi:hypothetical protein
LKVAPMSYQSVLASQQLAKGNSCTAEDLIDAMQILYRQTKNNSVTNTPPDTEFGMAAPGANAPTCWNCGKTGHRALECEEPDTNFKFKPTGAGSGKGKRSKQGITCDECGKNGHIKENCWYLEENKSKRPNGWKPKGEHGGAAMSSRYEDGMEIMMCQIDGESRMLEESKEFPETVAMLQDPNIWIGDTGASCHCTGHKQGLVNLKEAEPSDNITMGNATSEKVEQIGSLQGTTYDRYGTMQDDVCLSKVSYCPKAAFNLISISQMLSQGWELSGGKEFIQVTSPNGEDIIMFDIIIPTKTGCIFAACIKRKGECIDIADDILRTENEGYTGDMMEAEDNDDMEDVNDAPPTELNAPDITDPVEVSDEASNAGSQEEEEEEQDERDTIPPDASESESEEMEEETSQNQPDDEDEQGHPMDIDDLIIEEAIYQHFDEMHEYMLQPTEGKNITTHKFEWEDTLYQTWQSILAEEGM